MAKLKLRSAVLALLGARIGDVSNYTDFSSGGRQTMAGTGQVYKDIWIPALQWWGIEPSQFANAHGGTTATTGSPGTASPLQAYFGKDTASPVMIPVLAASCAENKDARAATVIFSPPDAATTGSVIATLYYTAGATRDTSGCMEVFRLRYSYMGSGGSAVDAGVTGSILYGACALTTGSNKLEVHTLGNLPSFRASTSPFVALELAIENSNTCAMALAPDENILGLRLRYVANSLGAAV